MQNDASKTSSTKSFSNFCTLDIEPNIWLTSIISNTGFIISAQQFVIFREGQARISKGLTTNDVKRSCDHHVVKGKINPGKMKTFINFVNSFNSLFPELSRLTEKIVFEDAVDSIFTIQLIRLFINVTCFFIEAEYLLFFFIPMKNLFWKHAPPQ